MDTLATRPTPRNGAKEADSRASLDVEDGLRLVEGVLREEVACDEPLLARMAADIVTAGGKRLRPRVTLLSYAALAPKAEEWPAPLAQAAAASELIHTATLVHDDIIDQSPMRRGRPTLHLTYGVPHAIVAADFLFTRGFGLAAELPKEVIRFTTAACTALAEGEVLEQRLISEDLDVETYFRIILKKTAEPLRACAQSGAFIAGGSPDVVKRYGQYGVDIGLAFQIQDDLLDILGDSKETGKPVGLDAKVGVRTLPELLAGAAGGRTDAEMIEAARQVAEDHVTRAKAAIDPVTPAGPHKDALMALADSVVKRKA